MSAYWKGGKNYASSLLFLPFSIFSHFLSTTLNLNLPYIHFLLGLPLLPPLSPSTNPRTDLVCMDYIVKAPLLPMDIAWPSCTSKRNQLCLNHWTPSLLDITVALIFDSSDPVTINILLSAMAPKIFCVVVCIFLGNPSFGLLKKLSIQIVLSWLMYQESNRLGHSFDLCLTVFKIFLTL